MAPGPRGGTVHVGAWGDHTETGCTSSLEDGDECVEGRVDESAVLKRMDPLSMRWWGHSEADLE